jgi:hypothetical protein
MKILIDILRDSQAHYLDVESKILKRLKEIPRGCILKRRFPRGENYFYLNFREGPRVVSKYLGKREPLQLIKQIEERRLLKNRLKDVRQSLAILNRLRWNKAKLRRLKLPY